MVEKRFFINSETFEYNEKNDLDSSFSADYENFENQYNTFYEGLFEEDQLYVPVSIFSSEIGTFQAIVKYLKEHCSTKFSEIAKLTGRDQRTIWNVYNKVKEATISVEEGEISIPLSVIKDRKFSVLESVILYLKEKGLSFNEIASLLKRNYQTIYTTHRKARGRMK
ncbi:hypothetical protein ACFLTH_13080 [Bacteroidota bacterium]